MSRFYYGQPKITAEQWKKIGMAKDAVNAAMKDLRSQGLITRQNFMCCGSCASYSIWSTIHEAAAGFKEVTWDEPCQPTKDNGWKRTRKAYGYEEAKAKQYRGGVFYSRQGGDCWQDGGGLYLNFGGVVDTPEGSSDYSAEYADSEVVGQMVVDAMRKQGLTVEWNGSHTNCVVVQIIEGVNL